MQGGSGQRIGVPTWARGLAEYMFGGGKGGGAYAGPQGTTGLGADVIAGQQQLPFYEMLQGVDPLGLSNSAARDAEGFRELVGYAYPQAFANQEGIAQQGMGLAQLTPQALQASNQFLQGGNQAMQNLQSTYGQAGGATGSAQQVLQNVMNPTAYNPMYQNAFENQLAPQINAAYASRGFADSGPGLNALSEGARDLSNDFATRQFQEQLGALGELNRAIGTQGSIAEAGGGLAGMLSQLPGSILGQFGQNLGLASDLQNAPLGSLGIGGELIGQGYDIPISTAGNAYSLSRAPMDQAIQALSGATGGFQAGRQQQGLFGIRK